jgi:glutamate dehydrogenase (NAD(P)+)
MEYKGATEAAALEAIEEKLRRNTRRVLDAVRDKGVLPREAAIDIATQRVRRAIGFKRWGLF